VAQASEPLISRLFRRLDINHQLQVPERAYFQVGYDVSTYEMSSSIEASTGRPFNVSRNLSRLGAWPRFVVVITPVESFSQSWKIAIGRSRPSYIGVVGSSGRNRTGQDSEMRTSAKRSMRRNAL
jgi:hypothetical protein